MNNRISKFNNKIEKLGYKIIEGYKNSTTNVRVVCPNGHERNCRYSSLKKYNCKECVNSEKLISLIKAIEDLGYDFISYPKSARDNATALCPHGHTRETKIYNFKNHDCPYCIDNNIKITIDEAKKDFMNQGFELLENNYTGIKSMMKYKCRCGRIKHTTLDMIRNNKIKSCNDCKGREMRGSLHPNWKGGITPENVKLRNSPEYREWRSEVFHRDKFQYQACRVVGGDLRAHHILNWHSNRELRHKISNGITLCYRCHDVGFEGSFHDVYGVMNNNKAQLDECIEQLIQ